MNEERRMLWLIAILLVVGLGGLLLTGCVLVQDVGRRGGGELEDRRNGLSSKLSVAQVVPCRLP